MKLFEGLRLKVENGCCVTLTDSQGAPIDDVSVVSIAIDANSIPRITLVLEVAELALEVKTL